MPSVALRDSKLIDAAPSSIAGDVNVQAICSALDRQFQELVDDINQCLILPRIDELSGPILDTLAWQFHVDFFDASLSDPQKRFLIKESLSWHIRKGTVGLVQEVLDTYFQPGSATLQEWFDYKIPPPPNYPVEIPDANGWNWHDRYRFRILVDQDVIDSPTQVLVERFVDAYKPYSRWREDTIRARATEGEVFVGIGCLGWKYVTIEAPSLAPRITELRPPEAPFLTETSLEVVGENFFFESVIHFNGNPIPTSFIDSQHVRSTNPFNVGLPGNKPVFVRSNMIDSNIVQFVVTGAVDLRLASLVPSNGFVNDVINLEVTGGIFDNTAVINFDGVELTTEFVSATRLRTLAVNVGGAGLKEVFVTQGTQTSNILEFAVAETPFIDRLIPAAAPINSTVTLLIVEGRNFHSSARINWNGADVGTLYVSPTEVRTTESVTTTATAGNLPVFVSDDRILSRELRQLDKAKKVAK